MAQEIGGARAGDGAEVVDQVLPVHADTVVHDRQGARRGVGEDADGELPVARREFRLRYGGVAQPIAGVGGVRDQLAQEDLFIAVQGMDDNIEKAADFRLKAEFFFGHVPPFDDL